MKNYLLILLCILFGVSSCKSKVQRQKAVDFLPNDYHIYQKLLVNLNSDAQEDCILIIKGKNKANLVLNKLDKEVDRNRRGIIVLLKKEDKYQLIDKNLDCFYSENEDGGNYYAPQLNISVDNKDIIFYYEHGRYGYWSYRFRLLDTNFKLIEYKATNLSNGPITDSETTIDFLTKEKLIRTNVNEEDEGNDEIFEDVRSKINLDKLIQLSEIKSFEELGTLIHKI